MELESAIYQWRAGERALSAAPPERLTTLVRVVDAIVAELRRRLGGRFTVAELGELYAQGTSWCLQLATTAAPGAPWAWDGTIAADAAFARYARDAVDYIGGRYAPRD
ncbi:MAG: hypothetical protein ACYCU0_07205 [Solirubrobacteraceae bacterium]